MLHSISAPGPIWNKFLEQFGQKVLRNDKTIKWVLSIHQEWQTVEVMALNLLTAVCVHADSLPHSL